MIGGLILNKMDTSMVCLLRQTFVTATPDEVCFVYTPKERIHKTIFENRFGNSVIESHGVTYSLTRKQLRLCFKDPPVAATTVHWTASIPPCAERAMVSVFMPVTAETPVHSMLDHVISVFAPEHAAESVGRTVVHFWRQEEADLFMHEQAMET